MHDERGSVALVFPSPYLLHAPTVLTVDEGDGDDAREVSFRSTVEAFERQWLAFSALALEGTAPRAGVVEGRADIVACLQAASIVASRLGLAVGGEAAELAGNPTSANRPAAVDAETTNVAEGTKEGKQ